MESPKPDLAGYRRELDRVCFKPDLFEYRQQLERVCSNLANSAEKTAVIGSNLCQWAWAEKNNRSVCLSWADEGVFVELWEGDIDVRESFEPSFEAGEQVAREWLGGK